MKKIILTLFTILPLTTVGCDDEPFDPIWGDWKAGSNGCNARTEFEVKDNYKGDGRYVTGDCTVCEVNLEVDANGDGEYDIEVDPVDCQGTLDLECELDGDELECDDGNGNRIDFDMD